MKRIRSIMFVFVILSMIFGMCSCAGAYDADDGGYGGGSYEGGWSGDAAPEVGGDSGTGGVEGDMPDDSTGGDEIPDDKGDSTDDVRLPAGMITAGAWVDNDNYEMWLDLFAQGAEEGAPNGKFYGYTTDRGSWGFNSLRRISVKVTSGDLAVAGATVTASDANGDPLFVGVTDAQGNAYLFTGAESGTVTVTSGDGRASTEFTADTRDLTLDLATSAEKLNVIEMMLVVDVTGSMGDEISFLKAELADVINRVCAADENTVVSLALLFYRDKTDNEMFAYYDFANVTTPGGMDAQQTALSSQRASGGGDYPEAVDEALELAVNKQWSDGATTKLIFFVLDAPPHSDDEGIERFNSATKTAAEKGIRICPILCSGAAGLTEYVMREAAIHTNGTFIFVTDDSGIGGSHHDPALPNVTVELLNSLMVRVTLGYHTGEFDEPIYWKEDVSSTQK